MGSVPSNTDNANEPAATSEWSFCLNLCHRPFLAVSIVLQMFVDKASTAKAALGHGFEVVGSATHDSLWSSHERQPFAQSEGTHTHIWVRRKEQPFLPSRPTKAFGQGFEVVGAATHDNLRCSHEQPLVPSQRTAVGSIANNSLRPEVVGAVTFSRKQQPLAQLQATSFASVPKK